MPERKDDLQALRELLESLRELERKPSPLDVALSILGLSLLVLAVISDALYLRAISVGVYFILTLLWDYLD